MNFAELINVAAIANAAMILAFAVGCIFCLRGWVVMCRGLNMMKHAINDGGQPNPAANYTVWVAAFFMIGGGLLVSCSWFMNVALRLPGLS